MFTDVLKCSFLSSFIVTNTSCVSITSTMITHCISRLPGLVLQNVLFSSPIFFHPMSVELYIILCSSIQILLEHSAHARLAHAQIITIAHPAFGLVTSINIYKDTLRKYTNFSCMEFRLCIVDSGVAWGDKTISVCYCCRLSNSHWHCCNPEGMDNNWYLEQVINMKWDRRGFEGVCWVCVVVWM